MLKMKSSKTLVFGAVMSALGVSATSNALGLPRHFQTEDLPGIIAPSNTPTDRYLVEVKTSALTHSSLENVANTLTASLGGTVNKVLDKHGLIAISLDKQAFNAILNHPLVESVELDVKRYLKAQTTPYGIPMVQADQVNQADTQAKRVCVIDSGYNLGHPDLPTQNDGLTGESNNFAVGSWNRDGNGHGTHVAGTIAAIDNQEGVIGVYPGVNMHIVKIFNDLGQWTFASDLIDGIDQCKQAGSDVVNMSLGGSGSSQSEANAMQQFVDDGMILVAAAGNDGNSDKSYPASYDAVVSVAALDSSETVASYSQFNDQVELSAPGSSVLSTYPSSRYASLSGTSMASPHVAGAMALVWSFYPQCTGEEIRSVMASSAKDLGAPGYDINYGHGLIQITDALATLANEGCEAPALPEEPVIEPTPEPEPPVEENDSLDETVTNLSGSRGSWKRFEVDVPATATVLRVTIEGGNGDADLYLNFGAQTQTNRWDCRPYRYGNNEVCTFTNPEAGTWHIGVRGYDAYNGVTLNYKYE